MPDDWKQRLRAASYRGVPFAVDVGTREGGRRAGVHEYPQRDTPLVEELGRVARTFSIEAYVVGDDYAERLERLVARLEGPSAGFPKRPGGTLVHPTLGQVEVLCTRYQVRETSAEGRMARVAMEFVEAGRELQPREDADPVGGADVAGEAAAAAGGEAYEETVQTSGVIQQALDAVEDVIREVEARLRLLDIFSGAQRSVEALEAALTDLVTEASVLVTAPADLVGTATDCLDSVLGAASSASGALEAYRVLFDLPTSDFPGEGSQAQAVRSNSAEAVGLFRALAVAGAVRAAARVRWGSLEEANEARAELELVIDELSAGTHDDLNRELAGLRAALVAAVPPPGEKLPEIVEFVPAAALPALVIAHHLYQDPLRDAEIVARNHVPNPLRVPGGAPLRVLSA